MLLDQLSSSLTWYGANCPVGQLAARYQCIITTPGTHPSGPLLMQHSTLVPTGKRSSTSGGSPGSGFSGSGGHCTLSPACHFAKNSSGGIDSSMSSGMTSCASHGTPNTVPQFSR